MRKFYYLLAIVLLGCSTESEGTPHGLPTLTPQYSLRSEGGMAIGFMYEIEGQTVILNLKGGIAVLPKPQR